ncbi:hypothetical protein RRG08_024481 [Elysia crispata]|uniref:Uncharacterized protein n=1 Tax=Elysia crispata TaxID=231223 RepID=A0AAE0YQD7_9GAST|nr:hypothetical protein RRG08_024481 [Elysia crispata]
MWTLKGLWRLGKEKLEENPDKSNDRKVEEKPQNDVEFNPLTGLVSLSPLTEQDVFGFGAMGQGMALGPQSSSGVKLTASGPNPALNQSFALLTPLTLHSRLKKFGLTSATSSPDDQ